MVVFFPPVTQLPLVTFGYHWFHRLPRFQDSGSIFPLLLPSYLRLLSVTIGSRFHLVFFPLLLPSYLWLPHFQDSGSIFPPQLPSITFGYHWFHVFKYSVTQLPSVTIGYHLFKIVEYFPPPVTFDCHWFHRLPCFQYSDSIFSLQLPSYLQFHTLACFVVSCFSP